MITEETRAYFAQIGRKGGQRSRRPLTSFEARRMVGVRLARAAYRKFHTLCFWSYSPDFHINGRTAEWVVAGLKRNGNRAAWTAAARIQALLGCL
jgi:hypothetical protein